MDTETTELSAAGALLAERYGEAAPNAPEAWNDTLSLLLSHRSVRSYRPDPLPSGALEAAIAAAQSASTSSNLQFWSVVAVEDPARKARLAGLAGGQKHVAAAPLFLVWLADIARIRAIAADQSATVEATPYLESFVVAVVDAALAAQNAAVAFESLGLGTVYIGGMRNHPQEVAAELGLPPGVVAVFGMCVGWPDEAADERVKPRLPQAAVLHRETYDPEGWRHAAAYDPILREFFAAQGVPHATWTRQALKRMRGPESLTGRHVLREVLGLMGFELK